MTRPIEHTLGQGHAAHFLTRLDRLEQGDVELALSLYNDVELLLEILRRAKIPDEVERAGIALGPPGRGPFLVVTRDGRFVTCLGKGMSPGRLPLVTREQLDGFALKMAELRARMEMSRRLSGSDAPSARLVQRVVRAGLNLSREEFVALSAWNGSLRNVWLAALARAVRTLETLLPPWLSTTKVTGKNEEPLRQVWSCAWSIAHLSMLLSVDARELCELIEAPAAREHGSHGPEAVALVTEACSSLCMTGGVLRGIHFAARAGKYVLPAWRGRFTESFQLDQITTSFASLTCIGIRHQRLRAKVKKALASHASDAPGWSPWWTPPAELEPAKSAIHELVAHLRRVSRLAFDQPDELVRLHREEGADWAVDLLQKQPEGSPLRFATRSDVPPDVALSILCNTHWDSGGPHGIETILKMLPWVARAKAEDLYLPRKLLSALDYRFTPELVLDFLAARRARLAKRAPEVVPPKPGRNEPCSCGSGKKYKRCCGA